MDSDTFERERLALFARYGFDGESHWITDRHGRRNYVISRGEGSHPTVLVHGGLSEASEWTLLAGSLPGHVVIADRPGCGLSHPIDYLGVDYRKAAVDWMADLVDSIGGDQVDLVANSMGGFFSIVFAIAHPDRVHRLVLVGAAAGLHREIPRFVRLWGNAVTGPLINRMKITDPEVLRRRVVAPLLVTHPEKVPLDLLRVMVAAAGLPGVSRASYTMLRRVTTLRGFRPELMLRDEMADFHIPTLMLWGDSDAFAPPSRGQEVASRMPDARFEVIPDAGHVPYLDGPDRIAAAITGFLSPSGGT